MKVERVARSKLPYKPIGLDTRIKIVSMAMEDYSIHSISKELKLAKDTVKKYLKSDEVERTKVEVMEVMKPAVLERILKIIPKK